MSDPGASSKRRHLRPGRVLFEGLIGGGIGALAALLPHLGLDLLSGEPLRTPTTLYALALGAEPAGYGPIQIVAFTALHGTLWVGVAGIAAYLVGVVDVHPRAWTAVVSLIVCVFATMLYVAGELSGPDGSGLPLWVGTLTGSVALAWTLAVRHGGVLRHFERVALTDTARHDLDLAYDHECGSRALYRAAAARWPDDPTLDELLGVSERRVELLQALFVHYGLELPEANAAPSEIPADLPETYRAAERCEVAKIALYDRFLLSLDDSRARELFGRLRWESSDECLEMLHAAMPRSSQPARKPSPSAG